MKLQTPIELHVQWLEDQLNATEMVLFKIQDENARLRKALKLIADTERDEDRWTRDQLITALRYCEHEARTALEGK